MAKKPDAFSEFSLDLPQSKDEVISQPIGPTVPNLFPTTTTLYRLAIIGEAPGADEVSEGKPFVGMSGRFLDSLLSKLSILRSACFIGNVCQHRPPGNDISKFDLDGPEITSGLTTLSNDLISFKPNLCLLLGRTALWAAKGTKAIFDWRGSVFFGETPTFLNLKCLASYHPAYCLRQYSETPVLLFDLKRALKESHAPTITIPCRDLSCTPSFPSLVDQLDRAFSERRHLSADIEGGVSSVSCISFSNDSNTSFIVPFTKLDGSSYWTIEEEMILWRKVSQILASPLIHKTWQNGLYDRFVLQWAHGLLIRNNQDDTLLKWWELYCELEKSLAFQTSILTDQPFYKFQRKTEDQESFYRYCCMDSAITFECNQKLEGAMRPEQKTHYHFNISVLNSLLYMELRGIKYDQSLASKRLVEIEDHVFVHQSRLDSLALELGALETLDFSKANPEILSQVQTLCGYKKDPSTPKKNFLEDGYWEAVEPLQWTAPLTPAQQGRLSSMAGCTMNTKSPKFKTFLYETCGLPTQWKIDPISKEPRIVSDYATLLKLSKSHTHPVLNLGLELSRLRTRAQMLRIRSFNGRMHCSYNLVGSETGRVTSSKSMLYVKGKRVGGNMQTIPDDWEVFEEDHPIRQGMRDLFLTDEDCYLAKCDLKGADGWTIGAYMKMLGDPTMLDDLLFGIKPAQVVAYILVHGQDSYLKLSRDRDALKSTISYSITKEMWEYFVSKIGIWGTFYTMGPRSLAQNVFIQSEGKVNLNESQARDFQRCILVRYNAPLWQNWMQRQIQAHPYPFTLTASNGFTRRFYNRKAEVLGEALAHLPQVYTTYATLLAASRLWNDPENRLSHTHGCKLRVEPLHQVHDELLVQFRTEDASWALTKIRQWFNNPITIANQKIIIPFDGSYGTTWAMDDKSKVGSI